MTNDLETFRHFLSIAPIEDLKWQFMMKEKFKELVPLPWMPTPNDQLNAADTAVYQAMKAAGRHPCLPHKASRLIYRIYTELMDWRVALAQYRDAHRATWREEWAAEQTRNLRTKMEKFL